MEYLQISSSGFHLQANGDVTASSFIAVNGGNILFDSNSEFIDGVNVGRVVYFDDTEYSVSISTLPDNSTPTTTTGSAVAGPSFHTFILPGETRIQASYTYEINRTDSEIGNRTFFLNTFIANSITGSYSGPPSKYGLFDTQASLGSAGSIAIAPPSVIIKIWS
jgi:hypothetical protein